MIPIPVEVPLRFSAVLLLLLSLAVPADAGSGDLALNEYATESEFLPTSPGVMGGAAGAFVMPAAWATNDRAGAAFWWNDRDISGSSLENWGLSMGRTLGLAVQHRTYGFPEAGLPSAGVTDWQLGLATGDRSSAAAVAWRWSTGDAAEVGREKALVLSTIHRPGRGLSLGLNGVFSVDSAAREGLVDVGLRPFGSPWITLFGDYALRNGQSLDEGDWGVGASLRPVPGIQLGVRLREFDDDVRLTMAAGVTLGFGGVHVMPAYDPDGERMFTSYLVETDGPRAPVDLPDAFQPGGDSRRIVALDLEGRVLTYQKNKWFDEKRLAWLDLARVLEDTAGDDDVDGVALNLAGFSGRASLLWELRTSLLKLRGAGKTVIVHLDRAGMLLHAVAAAADEVTIDPEGGLTLPGIDLSRTYMKDLLANVGLGFEALQYFEHKTAVEALSLDAMSDADKEQRGRIVDVIYEGIRGAVTAGRPVDADHYDAVVDDDPLLTADAAVEAGLVDRTGRWADLGRRLAEERRARLVGMNPAWFREHHDERWGRPPVVAVVYALGECAMESGIRGRATSAYMRRLAEDPNVAAVVLRADSPGGDPLPSDLIADAVTRLREAGKPVVVSQGDVAASGGYWISMNGTEILTTPLTITGSIGVISGWLWDEGLHEKVGLNADGVSRGKHADLFRSVRYPVGFSVVSGPMTDEESEYAKKTILTMYDRFVAAVAAGRGLEEDEVRRIGGGHVWMGGDAVELGLCDGFGGLMDAVHRAEELAGLAPDQEVELVEFPPRRLFDMPRLSLPLPGLGSMVGITLPMPASGADSDPQWDLDPDTALLDALSAWNGRPTAVISPDLLPAAWRRLDEPALNWTRP